MQKKNRMIWNRNVNRKLLGNIRSINGRSYVAGDGLRQTDTYLKYNQTVEAKDQFILMTNHRITIEKGININNAK